MGQEGGRGGVQGQCLTSQDRGRQREELRGGCFASSVISAYYLYLSGFGLVQDKV